METAGRAPALNVPHTQTAVGGVLNAIGPQGQRPSNSSLRTVRDAIDQNREAGKKKPSLSALGSEVTGPDSNAGSGTQKASAESFFNQKAGFLEIGAFAPLDYFYEAHDPAAGAGSPGRKKAARVEPAADPKYSSRRVKFKGKYFPSVAFRPDRPVADEIIKAIDEAAESIDISIYEFKQNEILKALRRARARKVKIRIIVDYKSAYPQRREGATYWPQRTLELQSLIDEGFDVTILRGVQRYGIMHNKFAVFDKSFAVFGSYNWSYTSERNHYENAVFTNDKGHIAGLTAYWDYLRSGSVPFADAKAHDWPQEAAPPPVDSGPGITFNGEKFPAWIFTPNTAAEDAIVRAIGAAEKSIDLSMFTFSSPRIARAILAAKGRRVKVRVLFDQSQAGQDFMKVYGDWLAANGVAVKTLAGPNPDGPEWAEKNHNKFMILDAKLVMTGSLNYTKSGFLTNYENMFFLTNKTDVAAFSAFYKDMFQSRRAATVVPPATAPEMPTDEQLIEGLTGKPEPPAPPPTWAEMPATRDIEFNGAKFPSSAVRPQNPIQDLIVSAIDNSKKTIELALYEFNLDKILAALQRAKKRDVNVRIILDMRHVFPTGLDHTGDVRTRSPQIQALMDEGFEIKVLRGVKASGIMHQKVGIFDGKMVEFGSYNWANTAENNHFEAVKFEDEKQRVKFYKKVWSWMWSYAVAPEDAETHNWAKERPAAAPIDEDLVLDLNGEKFPRQAFSPEGLVEDTLIRAIRAAKGTIEIAMFSFYSVRIAEELLRAKNSGVEVRLVLDKMQSKLMKLDNWFSYYGFDVKVVAGPNPDGDVFFEKNHNKFMLVDGKFLEVGSYNYTANAEMNSYENANFYTDKVEVAFFRAYFQMLYDTGWAPLKPKRPPEGLPEPDDFLSRPESVQEAASFFRE